MYRRAIVALALGPALVAGLALALVAALVATGATASASTRPATRYALDAIHATNSQRTAHHLGTLRFDRCLKRLANRQAARMAREQQLSHQSMTGGLRTCHLHGIGENVAQGFSTGAAVVNVGWMNSAPHRANILTARFRLMAVSATYAHGRWWVSQVFGTR